MITMETERLLIRNHSADDFSSLHLLLSDPVAMYCLDDIRTVTLEESKANLSAALDENCKPDRTKFFFAIIDRASGQYVGEVGYTVKLDTPVGKVVGLGYFLRPEFWRRGLAAEAAAAVLQFAFREGGVLKVETGCIRENGASEAVMKRLGMTKEADYRLHVWHDGRLKDRVEYRMLREEWELLQQLNS